MTASGSVAYGEILNKQMIRDVVNGDVAANTEIKIGWVYQDAGNGWKQSNGTQGANTLYWSDRDIDNNPGAKGNKHGSFYGSGSLVVTKADGALPLFGWVRASNTADHHGQTKALTIRTDTIANHAADTKIAVGRYLGHVGETIETNNDPTAATDTEETCIVCIERQA